MAFNILAVLVASLSTLLVGFVWYHPKVFGTIWMRETGMTEEKAQKSNMLKIFGLTIFLSILLSLCLTYLVIHQTGVLSLVGGNANDEAYKAFMEIHGGAFRTFKHGALHGFMSGIFIALPLVGINSLFEQKSGKYILITTGYWIVSMTLMGGIICAWQ